MVLNNTTTLFGSNDPVVALALVFGIMLMAFGFKRREFWVLAGPVWIISGLTIFISYGVVFLLASIGLGLVLLIEGVMNYA